MANFKFNKHLLLEIIHEQKGEVNISSKEFEGNIELNKDDFKENTLVFNDCVFHGPVSLTNIEFKIALMFVNCTFNESFSLDNIVVSNFNEGYKRIGVSILFSNCTFVKSFSIADCTFHGSIVMIDSTISERFYIFNLRLTHQNAAIEIKSSFFYSSFLISDVNLVSFIRIFKSVFDASVIFENAICWALIFSDSSLQSSLSIDNCNIKNQLRFLGSVIKNYCNFSQLIVNRILLNRSQFDSYLVFQFPYNVNNESVRDVTIKACAFQNGASFVGVQHPDNYSFLNELNITASRHLKGHLKFKDLYVNNVYLRGTNYDSHIVFENIRILKFNFDYFTNYDNLQINNLSAIQQPDSILKIYASSLGKTSFSNCLLSSFSNVSIIDSLLTDISAINVDWPSFNLINHGKDSNIDYKQNRELYRQLKMAMENQGDRIQALSFKQYEMFFYRKELKGQNKRIGDKMILFASWSNDYGQNWIKPIIILLVFTLIVSISLLLIFNCQVHDIGYTLCIYKKNYFILLDPTHSLQTMFGENNYISGWIYAIDILYKIIYAYLVFQTVSAFRKYIK